MSAGQRTRAGIRRSCGEPVREHDRFCEECGHPDPAARPHVRWADCGCGTTGADGYCERCGLRQPSGREHVEADVGGAGAAVSDLGLRRGRNEDAFALAALPGGACAVVCDGGATFRPEVRGLVLLCTDGLWNHLPEPTALAGVAPHLYDGSVPGPGALGARGAARRLVRAALDAGGHDNVTAAAIPHPPPEPSREPGR